MKNIVITGAYGGVGSLLSKGLAASGHHTICLGRQEEHLQKLVNDINSKGGSASYQLADMMDAQQVEHAGTNILGKWNTIDVWINNVGVNNHNAIGPSWELEPQHWWTEVSLNLYTAYLGTRTAINLMKASGNGYIFNLAGGGVQEPKPYGSAYGAAKTGVVKFTEAVNLELEQEGIDIKVFVFNPGFIRNARTEQLVASDVARQYMPKLEQILRHGVMSDPQDSIVLIEALISGKADKLAGRYFFADDKTIDIDIQNIDSCIKEKKGLLRVR